MCFCWIFGAKSCVFNSKSRRNLWLKAFISNEVRWKCFPVCTTVVELCVRNGTGTEWWTEGYSATITTMDRRRGRKKRERGEKNQIEKFMKGLLDFFFNFCVFLPLIDPFHYFRKHYFRPLKREWEKRISGFSNKYVENMPKYSRVEKVSRDLEDLKWEQNERAKFGVHENWGVNGKILEIMKNWNKRWKWWIMKYIYFFHISRDFFSLFCGDEKYEWKWNEMMKLMTYRCWIIWIFNISSA